MVTLTLDEQKKTRLDWLDALRGVAAMLVMLHHFAKAAIPEVYSGPARWWGAGTTGVLLFMAISGYLIPASLERTGSVRSFWIKRLFRLYPLWILAVAAAFVLGFVGLYPLDDELRADPVTGIAAHLTMLQELLGVPNAVNVMWTLAYEMVCYFLVAALFTFGVHRRSAGAAVGFGASALLFGGILPTGLLTAYFGAPAVVAVVSMLACGGLALTLCRHRVLVHSGAVILVVLALTLLAFNQVDTAWYKLMLPAAMFAGTAVYRVHNGQLAARKAAVAIGLVVGLLFAAVLVNNPGGWDANKAWLINVVSTVVLFGGATILRRYRMPTALTWLGVVSYSIYLLHPLVYKSFEGTYEQWPLVARLALVSGWIIGVLLASAVAYRLAEAPFQRLGRRVAKRWDMGRTGGEATSANAYDLHSWPRHPYSPRRLRTSPAGTRT